MERANRTAAAARLALRVETAAAEQVARGTPAGAAIAEVLPVSGGRAVWLGPGSAGSAALGMGLQGEVEGDDVDRMEAFLGRWGSPVRVEVAAPADGSLAAALGDRGYAVRGFQLVWTAPAVPSSVRPPGVAVRPLEPGEEGVWGEVLARALVGAPPGWRPATAGVGPRPAPTSPGSGEARFLAVDGGESVGAALVSACEGVALLSAAAVLPAHRGRGIHAALVAERLAWAGSQGCDLAAATVRPGAASQRTLERAGFRCAYPKAILVGSRRGATP